MATVTGFTSARMLAIENASVVDGSVTGDILTLVRKDGSTINAGSVRGPTGSPGVTNAELIAAMQNHMPVGMVVDFMGVVSPSTYWLTMIGQTITNAQSLYPIWWAQIPVGMKSGANAIMPDTRKKVSVGYDSSDTDFDTIGKVGGAKTHVLRQDELPAVTIAIDPPSTTVSIDPPATTVSVNPPDTDVSGNTGQASNAIPRDGSGFLLKSFSGLGDLSPNQPIAAFGTLGFDDGTVVKMAHTHSAVGLHVDIPAFNIVVDISAFNVNVDIPSFASAPLGSGTAMSLVQPYCTFLKLVKVL